MRSPRHVRATTIYRLIEESQGSLLSKAGYIRAKPRRWVRREAGSWLCHALLFDPPTSRGIAVAWGVWLDFVPHLSHVNNWQIVWDPVSVDLPLDLSHNPLDYVAWNSSEQSQERLRFWTIPVHEGLDAALDAVDRVIPLALSESAAMFEAISNVAHCVDALNAKLSRPRLAYGRDAGGWLEPQEQLAYAFSLAALRRSECTNYLGRYFAAVSGWPMPRATRRQLTLMLEGALAGHQPPYV